MLHHRTNQHSTMRQNDCPCLLIDSVAASYKKFIAASEDLSKILQKQFSGRTIEVIENGNDLSLPINSTTTLRKYTLNETRASAFRVVIAGS